MSTGPNEILLKRSDTTSSVPGHTAMSFGEVAVNASSGKMFFREQTSGTTTGNVWTVAGSTTEKFVISVNGQTGAVTVPVGSGTTLAAGAGMTLSAIVAGVGHTLGIDPTATIHVAGISSDGGVTASNVHSVGLISGGAGISLSSGDLATSNSARLKSTSGSQVHLKNGEVHIMGTQSSGGAFKVNATKHTATQILVAEKGISMDAAGITFPDGTFQSTAASSLVPDAGLTLNGSTLDIDPTAVVHVAGVSSDGGITASGDIRGPHFYGIGHETGLDVDTSNTLVLRAGNQQVLAAATSKVQVKKPLQADELIHAKAGISMDAAGITFPDGTFQSTAASSLVPDAGLTLNGSTLDIDPTAVVHVAGVSSDGGATFGDDVVVDGTISVGSDIFSSVGSGTPKISFSTTGGSTIRLRPTGSTALTVNNSSVEIPSNRSLVALGVSTLTGLVNTQGGISMDGAGITFPDGTFQSTAASGGGGGITQSIGFILDGSGAPLTTGEKLDALKQVPYGSSVLSTAAYIQDGVSGTDKTIAFSIKKASALSSVVSGTTLEIGATASADQTGFTFDGIGGGIHYRTLSSVSDTSGSTIGAGEWIYPVITGNSGDINKLQIFMTVIPT